MERDTFCSYCGARHSDVPGYPRKCPSCGKQVWANPSPVAVVLQPVVEGDRTGLLVVRRSIPPVGELALVGGFIEEHETWQESAAREMLEEASVVVAPESLSPLGFVSVPYCILLFCIAPPLTELPEFVVNAEASERRVIFEPTELAFAAQTEEARKFFDSLAQ
ncbi:ADP-ribose pyrophosphatase YjhB (NUDIX family) [Kibdelosporangium banguiense]|uniref:ADP-ribose pyrophosphatase YjhB (NUDIX family) n=1 Tax=Kibdelosporangium banguiense TaxID=1365924 RepID=A0ABS4TKY2_9PSEU|nr:NUDIX domain-containing protein [Kibdelosporangium banguiense]MBP2325083.1 ADP-ribose pyrophosphatase YjhB (NUDIX family) [Kibdelosporangium banguiense]